MSDTGLATFTATLQKTNEVLGDIEEAFGWSKGLREQSYSTMRAVLHAIRDRLTVQESAQLAAQLPILIRGIFFEGWDPDRVPAKMHREEFLDRVRRELDFDPAAAGGLENIVKTVVSALSRFITAGELEDVKAAMPRDIADLVA
jgi:uncharacterized protein (DUF2267 family)